VRQARRATVRPGRSESRTDQNRKP
jgi:hypothetical protein